MFPVRIRVAPPPAIVDINWRRYLALLPSGDHAAAPQLSAEAVRCLPEGHHPGGEPLLALSHLPQRRSRGYVLPAGVCCCVLEQHVELLRPNDGTVYAMRPLTPHTVANPHNPFFPLVRFDSRAVTWELLRPSPGVSR